MPAAAPVAPPAPEATPAPAPDPASALPKETPESGDSFYNAVDAALGDVFSQMEAEFKAGLKPEESKVAAPEPKEEPKAGEKPKEEPKEEPKAGDEIDTLLNDLPKDGDELNPAWAKRYSRLGEELKTSMATLEATNQKVQQYEARIKELEGITGSPELETLRTRVKELERTQSVYDLESTQAYKDAVTVPLNSLLGRAREFAEKHGADPETMFDLLALNDENKQEETASDMFPTISDREKARLFQMFDELKPILERRGELKQNAEQALREARELEETRSRETAAQAAAARQDAAQKVADRVWERLPMLSTMEGLDKAALVKEVSEVDPSTLHPVDQAYASVVSKMFPNVIKEYMALRNEVNTLTARLADFEKAEPGQHIPGSTSPQLGGPDPNLSFTEAVERALAGVSGANL